VKRGNEHTIRKIEIIGRGSNNKFQSENHGNMEELPKKIERRSELASFEEEWRWAMVESAKENKGNQCKSQHNMIKKIKIGSREKMGSYPQLLWIDF